MRRESWLLRKQPASGLERTRRDTHPARASSTQTLRSRSIQPPMRASTTTGEPRNRRGIARGPRWCGTTPPAMLRPQTHSTNSPILRSRLIQPPTHASTTTNEPATSWHLHEVHDTVPSSELILAVATQTPTQKATPTTSRRALRPQKHPTLLLLSTAAVPEAHIVTHVHNGKRFFYCKKTAGPRGTKLISFLQPRDRPSQPKPEPRAASAGTDSPAGDVANLGPLVPRRNSRRRK